MSTPSGNPADRGARWRTHPAQIALRITLLAALLTALLLGSSALTFICDDAFIAFRYVANARAGHGLVWNPEPFAPVEGYTSFSWVMCLWALWSWFVIAPTDAANPLSLACVVLQFGVVAAFLLSMRGREGRPAPLPVVAMTLLAIISNRTFLQWHSSGLETPLFNLLLLAWALIACRRPARLDANWLAGWSSIATLIALTRPDGLLFVAATAAVAAWLRLRGRISGRQLALGLAPLLGVGAHIAWRLWFYGEWLPNTYYAKIVSGWPEAGWRYLVCFLIEHGGYVWLLLASYWLWRSLRRVGRQLPTVLDQHLPTVAVVAAFTAHAGYYIVRVGGDHFEYRVLSHLVPLGAIAAKRLALDAMRTTRGAVVWLLMLALTSSVGWLHLWLTRDMGPNGLWPIANRCPAIVQPLVRHYDRLQGWLHLHFVGLRCNQHARALERMQAELPARGTASSAPNDLAVHQARAVGWRGWILNDCAILDLHGLNDWVVAHAPAVAVDLGPWRAQLRPILLAGDRDGDRWLSSDELRAIVGVAFSQPGASGATVEAMVRQMLFLCARQRDDTLAIDEIDSVFPAMLTRRHMAHERSAPEGYIEDFEPNVTVVDGEVRIAARDPALTEERVRAIEARWRQQLGR